MLDSKKLQYIRLSKPLLSFVAFLIFLASTPEASAKCRDVFDRINSVLSWVAQQIAEPERKIVIGVVDPVSSAALFSKEIFYQTGRKAIHIKTQEYSSDFIDSFNPNDPYAELVVISNPPTREQIKNLRQLGITHLLTGPISLEITQRLAADLDLPIAGWQDLVAASTGDILAGFLSLHMLEAESLPRVGPDGSVLTNKAELQNVLRRAGETYIPGRIVNGYESALAAYKELGPEVVLKPNSGYGTVGVAFVKSLEDFKALDPKHFNGLMEKLIRGVEHFVDFVSYYNPLTRKIEHRFVNAARYRKVELVTHSPIYSSIRILPYRGVMQDRMAAQVRRGLGIFKMRSGNTHAEFMLEVQDPEKIKTLVGGKSIPEIESVNKIYPIEYNFRMPGGLVPYYARKYALKATDLNHVEASILSIGDSRKLAETPEGWTLENHLDISFLFTPRAGRLNLEAVLALKDRYPEAIKEIVPSSRLKHGDPIKVTGDLFDSFGKIIIAHPSDEVVTRVSEEIFEMCMNGMFLLPEE